jgi:hypothetical protein
MNETTALAKAAVEQGQPQMSRVLAILEANPEKQKEMNPKRRANQYSRRAGRAYELFCHGCNEHRHDVEN